jgi:DNA polymerase III subunit gamma/tau
MENLALYRECRPQFFRDVVGQEHVSRTLKNAVRMNRIAHAYLFCGPRGTGKTSTARILAKAVNCLQATDGEPCNKCPSCSSITQGTSLDVVEMDAASHRGIDEVRELRQKVGFAPTQGRFKVYIIDEVHMLTGEAFNALLKVLEEPPRHTIFILATTEAHKVPPTILSRCQRFDFRPLGSEVIAAHLQKVAQGKGWEVEPEALAILSRRAGGALRDALGLLDQAASFAGNRITKRDVEVLLGSPGEQVLEAVVAAVTRGDVPALLRILEDSFSGGVEPREFLFQLTDYVRQFLFQETSSGGQRKALIHLLKVLAKADAEMKVSNRADLVLELHLLRLTESFLGESEEVEVGESKPGSVTPCDRELPPFALKNSPYGLGAVPPCEGELGAKEDSSGAPGSPEAEEDVRLVVAEFFRKRPLLRQFLPQCEFRVESGRIIIAAPKMAFDYLQKPEHMVFLQKALQDSGCSLKLSVILKKENHQEEVSEDREGQQEETFPSGDSLIGAALAILKGEIVSQEKEEDD